MADKAAPNEQIILYGIALLLIDLALSWVMPAYFPFLSGYFSMVVSILVLVGVCLGAYKRFTEAQRGHFFLLKSPGYYTNFGLGVVLCWLIFSEIYNAESGPVDYQRYLVAFTVFVGYTFYNLSYLYLDSVMLEQSAGLRTTSVPLFNITGAVETEEGMEIQRTEGPPIFIYRKFLSSAHYSELRTRVRALASEPA